jgi:hypothetical protein
MYCGVAMRLERDSAQTGCETKCEAQDEETMLDTLQTARVRYRLVGFDLESISRYLTHSTSGCTQ